MRFVLAAALLLAGCEREPAHGMQPAPSSTPMPGAAPQGTTVAVRPGALRTFGDWAVGCDNTALCQMASLNPDTAPPAGVTMAVLRQPGRIGAVDLSFDTVGKEGSERPVALLIDGRRLPLAALNGPTATTVAQAMAGGRQLEVMEASDRAGARLSLAGAAAALRWIDAQQGRAGTVTAIVARGQQPAETVPHPVSAPVIRATAATGTGTSPTAAQLAAMRTRAECDERAASGTFGWPETHALGNGATLVLLPCSTGAYNLSSALFVLRDGTIEPAFTDAPVGFDATPAAGTDRVASVVNGAWRDGELTSDAKGRGLGDCGVHQILVWDGTRLRLTEQSEMRECRGNPHFITTWRAQVLRG